MAEFRELWERHDVTTSATGKKEFLLPGAGTLAFVHSTFTIAEIGELMMTVYTPVEGTDTDRRMELLLDESL